MTVIVLGGTRGIGLAISKEFAARGRPVAMVYRSDEEAAKAAADAITESPTAIAQADVSDPDQLARAYDQAEKLGPVDCIVHSAVLYMLGSAIDGKLEDLDKAWAVGPRAFLAAAKLARDRMTEGGHLIAVGSVASMPRYSAGYGILGPAKSAIDHLVVPLGVELAPLGIRVNCVATGTVDGHFVQEHPKADRYREVIGKKTPLGRIGTEQDVARAVAMLASPDADWIIGQTIIADGGMSLHL
jgi:NAD(P)-dependent dehydrogenase (short-subunit alcohol dehydrogenase family)